LPDCTYQQAEVSLAVGDLLVIYTDGFSEAMNCSLEEWGEKRLIAAAREAGDLPAEAVIAGIARAADEFAAGAPQHDDMTLVVVRAVEAARPSPT
jgi:sigma-B regulation protein RsbU (phosphoserine phosphatase)